MRLPTRAVRAAVAVGSRPLGRPVPVPVQRRLLAATGRLAPPPRGTTVERVVVGGRPAERVSAPRASGPGCLLLLHGGAFITGSPATHRGFAALLSAASGRPVVTPDYRLAPEHPYPAAVEDADAALGELLAAGPVGLVGDSAGGALAVLVLVRRRDAGQPLPASVGLVSPLADLTLRASSAYRGRDPLLRRSWLRQGVSAFLAGADPQVLSPLELPLHGLPRTLVQVSEHERLRPEGERLATVLADAGTPVELALLPGVWHDVHVQATVVREGADAVRRLGRWVAAD